MVNMTEVIQSFNEQTGSKYRLTHFFGDKARQNVAKIILKRNELITSDVGISTALNISQLANMFPKSIKVQTSWSLICLP